MNLKELMEKWDGLEPPGLDNDYGTGRYDASREFVKDLMAWEVPTKEEFMSFIIEPLGGCTSRLVIKIYEIGQTEFIPIFDGNVKECLAFAKLLQNGLIATRKFAANYVSPNP
jgi:hypothetical protein